MRNALTALLSAASLFAVAGVAPASAQTYPGRLGPIRFSRPMPDHTPPRLRTPARRPIAGIATGLTLQSLAAAISSPETASVAPLRLAGTQTDTAMVMVRAARSERQSPRRLKRPAQL